VEEELPHFIVSESCLPHPTIRESGVRLAKAAHTYANALFLHAASENKRVDHVVKCIFAARPDCATPA
jgi:hypothetical protein